MHPPNLYLMPVAVVVLYLATLGLVRVASGWKVSGGFSARPSQRELGWHLGAMLVLGCVSPALIRVEHLVPGVSVAFPFLLGVAAIAAISKRHRRFEAAPRGEHWTDDFLRRWGMRTTEPPDSEPTEEDPTTPE